MQLTQKVVLITGASSGLGRALALALAARNNTLIVTARRGALLETLAAEIEALGGRALPMVNDATDSADCLHVVEAAYERFGRIDVAVLNVGGATAMTMGQTATVEATLATMRQNYDSLVNYLIPLISRMRDAGGVIAYTGSPAGTFGLPKSGPYSAAKAAGRILLDTCRIELANTPLRFVALYPGFTYTEGLQADEVPIKSLIISKDRAIREMITAIERERSHWMFPRRIRWLIALARLMPEPLRRRVLGVGVKAG